MEGGTDIIIILIYSCCCLAGVGGGGVGGVGTMCRQAISHEDKETNTKVYINRDILHCKNRKCLQHT